MYFFHCNFCNAEFRKQIEFEFHSCEEKPLENWTIPYGQENGSEEKFAENNGRESSQNAHQIGM